MSEDKLSIIAENKSNELPTRRETLTEALASLVTVGNSGIGGVILFALGIIFLAWTADSIFPFLQDFSIMLYAGITRDKPAETKFVESFSKAIVPITLFIGLILFLYWLRRRNSSVSEYLISVPNPHEGLIVMLSDYRKLGGQPGYDSPDEIVKEIENNRLDIELVFSGCNWGQSAFAVNFHAPALKELWVITTEDKSSAQFERAKKLFKFIAGNSIKCDEVKIKDSSNISEAARKISHIFRQLSDLKSDQIISDITGGSSAMSGGMILATLDEGRKIEYVRQGITLKNFSPKEIREQNLIISPRTSPRMAQIFGGGK